MSAGDPQSARREDLAALRLDRRRAPPPPPRWRRPVLLGAGALALAAAGLLAWRLSTDRMAEVQVAYAARRDGGSARSVVLTGAGYVVTAERYISLGVRVPGRVEEYLVEEGERVTEGQAVVRLDARRYESALREARAQLREAKATVALRRKELDRARELSSAGVASQAELDAASTAHQLATAQVETLEARIVQLELDLEDTVLRSPVDGMVLEKFKEVGEIAVPGGFAGSGELIRIANLDELRAEIDVNEGDLAKIELGQPAEVVPDAYPEARYEARVVKLYPQINRQKGTLKVEVRILEPDAKLRPDMSARISFLRDAPAEAGPSVVQLPRAALRREDGAPFVWLLRDGRLERRALELAGDGAGDPVSVISGLDGGEAVVVGEAGTLAEGQRARAQGDG